jgi:hypothetical protein
MRDTLRTTVLGCVESKCRNIFGLCLKCSRCPAHCGCKALPRAGTITVKIGTAVGAGMGIAAGMVLWAAMNAAALRIAAMYATGWWGRD